MSGINFGNLPPFVEEEHKESDSEETNEFEDSSSSDENGDSSSQEDEDLEEDLDETDGEDYEEEILDKKKTQKEEPKTKDKSKSTKDLPFNEHPRFKHLIKENKVFKNKLEKQESLISNLEQILKQNGLIEEDNGKVDLTKMTKQELSEFIKQITSKEEPQDNIELELEDKLLEMEEEGKKFNRKELLSIAVEETDGDLDMAYKIYRREQNLLDKAKQSFKKEIARKSVSESIGKRSNGMSKDTSPKNVLKSFDDLRRDAYEKFN